MKRKDKYAKKEHGHDFFERFSFGWWALAIIGGIALASLIIVWDNTSEIDDLKEQLSPEQENNCWLCPVFLDLEEGAHTFFNNGTVITPSGKVLECEVHVYEGDGK